MKEEVFEEFSSLLETRLKNDSYTTEDAVRYTFFVALTRKTSIEPHEIMLEYPYDVKESEKASKEKIDTYIESSGNKIAIEFKYHRELPSKKNSAKTQLAGKLFNDICRLYRFNKENKNKENKNKNENNYSITRYLVYLTRSEMANYFEKNFPTFFNSEKCEVLSLEKVISKKINKKEGCKTFQKQIKKCLDEKINQVKIRCVWKKTIINKQNEQNKHELRIYEVW